MAEIKTVAPAKSKEYADYLYAQLEGSNISRSEYTSLYLDAFTNSERTRCKIEKELKYLDADDDYTEALFDADIAICEKLPDTAEFRLTQKQSIFVGAFFLLFILLLTVLIWRSYSKPTP
jgi:hypothetical protein